MPNLRAPKCPGQVSGRKTVLQPQASQRWEARRDSGGARSRSVQVLRPSPPLAKAQSGPFPALLHPHPSFTEGCEGVEAETGRAGQPPKAPTASKPFQGCEGVEAETGRAGQPPKAPTASKPFPTQQPNPSELTFQRFLKGFFPNHTILSSFPCVFPQLISLQPHRHPSCLWKAQDPSSFRAFALDHHVCILHPTFRWLFFFFLVALSLYCCTRAFSSCSRRGLLFIAMLGLLTLVASLIAEHRL